MSSKGINKLNRDKSAKSSGSAQFERGDLKFAYIFTLIIAVLTLAASLAGVLYPEDLYPTADLQESSVPNDVVTCLWGCRSC